ncbi:unnamed protein product [Vitrella brassicaformis CCMP3155]|uniref:Carboxylic ester hydrolase n=2 Tax=Vitrella brassicaformis TaxID=1169539 RepID=A0A0G4F593_VITBC|nr:unnamed protein product [Vitrella brassicaformis CCMP3155]|mmetsp:Transcript_4683/g.12490  ORF Transcript_4683/g.12490 Transcript_4683/m.12490 type:complete len:628 (+) Transcript_4683:144-2027(+)|eukprot:CEM06902.1 unnamed protein product [Vitrella brassicaformis CCMP3155]
MLRQVILALASLIPFLARASEEPAAAVTVTTPCGPVVGHPLPSNTSAPPIFLFEAIPYALPPTHERRWQLPEPHTGWTEPYDGRGKAVKCPQPTDKSGALVIMSEDCLQLSVWTPYGHELTATDEAAPRVERRHVLVVIHGGGFAFGSGTAEQWWAPGEAFLRITGAIVVGFNYRVGVLGTLAHPWLGTTTNIMLEDQRLALEWVQRSIGAFGGDPSRVTLYGVSAGAQSVLNHLMWRPSAGLFRAAIVSSAPIGYRAISLEEAYRCRGEPFVSAVGAKSLDDLRTLPWQNLTAFQPPLTLMATGQAPALNSYPAVHAPIYDRRVVPLPNLLNAPKLGLFQRKPIIITTSANEYTLFGLDAADMLKNATSAQLKEIFVHSYGPTKGAKVYAEYRALAKRRGVLSVATGAAGDAMFQCPNRYLASQLAARGWPVRLGLWEVVPDEARKMGIGAFHGVDMIYTLGQIDQEGFAMPWFGKRMTFGREHVELMEDYLKGIAAFMRGEEVVRLGNGVVWEVFDPSTWSATLEIEPRNMHLIQDVVKRRHRCGFWDALASGDQSSYGAWQPFAIPPHLLTPRGSPWSFYEWVRDRVHPLVSVIVSLLLLSLVPLCLVPAGKPGAGAERKKKAS